MVNASSIKEISEPVMDASHGWFVRGDGSDMLSNRLDLTRGKLNAIVTELEAAEEAAKAAV